MRVTLDDVNESPPAFTMSVYTASIVEQSGADTSVLDVSNLTEILFTWNLTNTNAENWSGTIPRVFISVIIDTVLNFDVHVP